MVMRLFLVYAVVELAVIVAVASAIGVGWTILLLLASFLVGVALAGSQIKRHVQRLRSGLTTAGPGGQARVVTDSALVALGAVLVVIPGLASSLGGLLLLLPPVRALLRPVVISRVQRRIDRGSARFVVFSAGAPDLGGRGRDSFGSRVYDADSHLDPRRGPSGRADRSDPSDPSAPFGAPPELGP